MNAADGQGALPAAQARLVDRVCDAFESAWREGGEARAEDHLADFTGAVRAALLRELLVLELEYRRARGEQPQIADYVARLGADAPLAEEAFHEAGTLLGQSATPPPTTPNFPGYEVLGELGRGGMGVVYKARQIGLERMVALKVLLGGAAAGPERLARFRAEALACARLQHPNVVRLYEVGEVGGVPFLCLEYVAGGNLLQHLAGETMRAPAVASLLETLARTLAAAHEAGIVHRDLKPANVLLADDGTPRVSDFGLAKLLGETDLTQSRVVIGTPGYMAPEQADGRTREAGPLADVWALGAILYQCLTGRPPFLADTAHEVLRQVLHDDPLAPRQLRPGVPRDLETICLKCLEKEPARRYASAQELADDLGRFSRGEPVRARPLGALGRGVRWARRRPTGAALLATLLLVGLVGFPGALALWMNAREASYREQSARQEANQLREDAERRELHLAVMRGITRCEQADFPGGLRDLLRSLRLAVRLGDEPLERAIRINLATWATQVHRPGPLTTVPLKFIHSVDCTPDGKTAVVATRFLVHRFRLPELVPGGSGLEQLWHNPRLRLVWRIAISPDGQTALTTRSDGTARLWNLEKGTVRAVLSHPPEDVWDGAFSPEGKRCLTVGKGSARVWESASGRLLATLPYRGTFFTGALFPGGNRAITGGGDGMVRLWDVNTGKAEPITLQHPDRIRGVAVHPRGDRILTLCRDGQARVWRLRTLQTQGEPMRHLDEGLSLAVSPDWHLALVGCRDGTARLWSLGSRARWANRSAWRGR